LKLAGSRLVAARRALACMQNQEIHATVGWYTVIEQTFPRVCSTLGYGFWKKKHSSGVLHLTKIRATSIASTPAERLDRCISTEDTVMQLGRMCFRKSF